MAKNIEALERIVRIIGGCAIFYLIFFTGPKLLPMQTVVGSLSLYPVITGIFGRCLLYKACDISTYHEEPAAPVASLASVNAPQRKAPAAATARAA